MDDIQQLIEQAKAVMTCPTCGRYYQASEISFKGSTDQTYILQAMCANEHPSIYTTWITSFTPPVNKPNILPITTDHILELHTALNQFDGNFKRLWSTER